MCKRLASMWRPLLLQIHMGYLVGVGALLTASVASASRLDPTPSLDPTPPIDVYTIHGDNPSPLLRIRIGDDMSFQAFHRNVPGNGQFFPTAQDAPADMGIFAR